MNKAVHSQSRKLLTSYEVNNSRSMTDPDASLSVRDIMSKFAQGISIPTGSGTFSGKNPDTRFWEIEDFHRFKKENAQLIADLEAERDANLETYNAAVRDGKINKLKQELEELKLKQNE